MLHVVAIVTAKPGKRTEVLTQFHAIVPTVLAEAGCIQYAPTVDAGVPGLPEMGPDVFVVVEKWESAAALDAHSNAPHMQVYREAIADLVTDVRVYALAPA